MIDHTELSRRIARPSQGEAKGAIAGGEVASITRLAGSRWLLDPLVVVPFALIAVWAVLAAATIAGFGEFPISGEEILITAPSTAEQGVQPSAAVADDAAFSASGSR